MLKKLIASVAILASVFLLAGDIYAHERREVANYQLVVGFMVEPAFEGLKNGVSLSVTNNQTGEPVEGLEETLQVELTYVPTGVSETMNLRAIFGDPGHYTADLIPTAPGHYRMRFFGNIEGAAIDETFESRSGGGGFDDVEPVEALYFPESISQPRELEGAVRGAQDAAVSAQHEAIQAQDSASTASLLGIIGIVLGGIGVASGIGAAVLVLRK